MSQTPAGSAERAPRSVEEWLAAVKAAEREGELLDGFDLAGQGLSEHPESVLLKHRAVLALARAGSTDQARRRFNEYGLADVADEDVQALGARIMKDVALAATGAERKAAASRSAALYNETFARTRGYYPGINAATMTLVAGDAGEAGRLAHEVLEVLAHEQEDSYYTAASTAEAELLLGRAEPAQAALERAVALHDGDHGALSTTRRQLRLICQETGLDEQLLAILAGPTVVHYCGHRISPPSRPDGRFDATDEPAAARRVAGEVAAVSPGHGYGSLASGADILWAEALIAHGARLHVVLPFAAEEFVRTSVAGSGAGWASRFERCLAAAEAVSYATRDAYLGDDVLYRYSSELAMGLALMHARFLGAAACQLALWDGRATDQPAGTAIDVATWRRRGNETRIVPPSDRQPAAPQRAAGASGSASRVAREVRAILFGDIKGFSKLTDEQLLRYNEHVMTAFAAVLARHEQAVSFRNTWGDGLYVVLTDVSSAAACALDLQDAMAAIDLEAHGLPAHLALRLSAHVGPVFPVEDAILGTTAFMGSHVSLTARIEPVTPSGAVYVTEPFSAALTLEGGAHAGDYVGHMPAAKDYGSLRMYRLRRRTLTE